MPEPVKKVKRAMTAKEKKAFGELDARTQKKRVNQERFLEGLKETGTIRNGLRKAGVIRWTYREWMEGDPEFPDRVLDARQEFAEALEEVVVGIVMDPDTVKKVPILAITLLNANLPNKYRPTAIVQDEAARDLLREWRKAARENPREVGDVKKQLDEPIEEQIHEILRKKQDGG